MRIIIQKRLASSDSILLFTALVLAVACVYSVLQLQKPQIGIGLGIGSLFVGFMGLLSSRSTPVMVIDDKGILDPRLGIGLVDWEDITEVSIQAHESQRFLTLHVKDPDKYFQRLTGIKLKRMQYHRNLGFSGFNLDIRSLNVSPLALKSLIDQKLLH